MNAHEESAAAGGDDHRSLPPWHARPDELTETLAKEHAESIARFASRLPEKSLFVRPIAQYAWSRAGFLLATDPSASDVETRGGLRLAAQAGTATCVLAARAPRRRPETTERPAPDEETPFRVTLELPTGAVKFALPPFPPRTPVSATLWENSLWAAVICRERRLVDELVAAPPTETRGQKGLTTDPYVYAWAEAACAFFRRDPDVFAKINDSMELTAPEKLVTGSDEVALLRAHPAMRLLFDVAAGRADSFDEGLREAVRLHHRYWTTPGSPDEIEPDRSSVVDGFFALAPTALAALALDLGMPVEVSSPYLPARLVRPPITDP